MLIVSLKTTPDIMDPVKNGNTIEFVNDTPTG